MAPALPVTQQQVVQPGLERIAGAQVVVARADQPGGAQVRVTMNSVDPKLELLDDKQGPNVTLSNAAASR